jgi:hypothetical protein
VSTATVDRNKLYGVLHGLDGQAIERQARVLKVGIGVPIGPDVHTWIDAQHQWCVEIGVYSNNKRQSQTKRFAARVEAQTFYGQQRKAPGQAERKTPRKIPYFTFLRMDGRGQFVHDFDAIEQHGPTPTEIDVVFLTEQNFNASFQMWSASKLLCEGDGRNARRHVEMGTAGEAKRLAEEARKRGERFFPIIDGCFARGCPYARGEKPACKPHGRLYFQLVQSPRIGGACQFDTTGYRSISQLASSLKQIRSITGRGDPELGTVAGIPLKLVLRPYRAQHQGQNSIQYGVNLEFRATSAVELARLLDRHTKEFREAVHRLSPPTEVIAYSSNPETLNTSGSAGDDESQATGTDIAEAEDNSEKFIDGDPGDAEANEAAALSAEFYGNFAEHQPIGNSPIPEASAMPRRRSENPSSEAMP